MVQDSSASCAAVTCYERRKIKFVLPASMHITQVQRELPENQGDATQLDHKLEALRDYVSAHLDDLATVSSRSLKAVFARQRNSTERSFYKFLWSSAKRFTEAQRSQGDRTLALLLHHRESRGDAYTVAKTAAAKLKRALQPNSGRRQFHFSSKATRFHLI